ncbi:MAG: T9SS type A sorting domain-containing protein [Chlorobi bacterium]|nr:T9SS type A sorting domain-containing protein [Chlorobiota bacterium]
MAGLTEDDDTVLMHFDPENILLDFPLIYGDSYDETYITAFKLPLPEPEVDSVWIKNTIEKETNVDAWGSLTIPMGTFDVLRQRVDEMETDSTFIMMAGTGTWIFFSVTQDSSTTYSWWTDNVSIGFELFEMEIDKETGDVSYVSFMNSLPVGFYESNRTETRVFPNPVSHVLNIEFTEAQTGELILINQFGQAVLIQKLDGQKSIQLQLSQFNAGMYFYRLSNVSGKVTGAGKFIKR